MNFILWLILPLFLATLATGLRISFYLTRRQPLGETHNPGEFGLDFEEVAFATTDGVVLHGWWIPAPGSERAVIVMHGHGGSMDYDVFRAAYLRPAGFNVLLFDFRAHGRSQGRKASFGYLERRDVLGAVEFLGDRGMRQIGLLGFSYGGMIAILSAAICPEISAVIVDGPPARLRTAITGRGLELGIPRWLAPFLAWLTIALTSLRLGVNLFQYEPARWVGRIAPRPILFIHGDLDQYCPDFDELYTAALPPKEIWRLTDVGHTQAGEVYPEEHQRRIVEFLERWVV